MSCMFGCHWGLESKICHNPTIIAVGFAEQSNTTVQSKLGGGPAKAVAGECWLYLSCSSAATIAGLWKNFVLFHRIPFSLQSSGKAAAARRGRRVLDAAQSRGRSRRGECIMREWQRVCGRLAESRRHGCSCPRVQVRLLSLSPRQWLPWSWSCISCRGVPCAARELCRQHLLQQGRGLAAADTEPVAHPWESAKVSVVPAASLSALQSRAGADNSLASGKPCSQGMLSGCSSVWSWQFLTLKKEQNINWI